jgi:Flp pilus assembly protein TadB
VSDVDKDEPEQTTTAGPGWQLIWRIPLAAGYLLWIVLVVVVAGPAMIAFWEITDDRFPHPGELSSVLLGAVAYHICGGLAVWAWWTGQDATVPLLIGAVMLGFSALLMLWAWNDHRRRRNRCAAEQMARP